MPPWGGLNNDPNWQRTNANSETVTKVEEAGQDFEILKWTVV